MLVNLKAALAARRVRQFELAAQLGVSPSIVSEIVAGRRDVDAALRARIAALLEADVAWLFAPVVVRARRAECAMAATPVEVR